MRGTRQRVSVMHSTLSGHTGQRMPCVSSFIPRQASRRLIGLARRGGLAGRGRLGGIVGLGCAALAAMSAASRDPASMQINLRSSASRRNAEMP
jgi:hypothetical protein